MHVFQLATHRRGGVMLMRLHYVSRCHFRRSHTKPRKWLCAQRRLRSAWASAQCDQSLRCALNGYLRTQTFFMRTAKTLSWLGGCPGWSESSLGAQTLCWFCHDAAHFRLSHTNTTLHEYNFLLHSDWLLKKKINKTKRYNYTTCQ